ncbi:SH3 domain-containing protein [Qipengyuania nanhaisediminis]|uniref:SH3 domain-containing protein n=1 Tax=Qipengyuania nanhaisediminis TaxID=604088 RepID=UPI0038B2D179
MKSLRPLVLALSFAVLAVAALTVPAQAQDREVPYWAVLRFDEVNMRVGPSEAYRIAWVYRRQGLPVRVLRLREGWRLVQDHEGEQGWIASSQLRLARGVLVTGEGHADIRAEASPQSSLRWRAEPGVVGALLGCEQGYCEVDIAGRTGWIAENRLWGAGEP